MLILQYGKKQKSVYFKKKAILLQANTKGSKTQSSNKRFLLYQKRDRRQRKYTSQSKSRSIRDV